MCRPLFLADGTKSEVDTIVCNPFFSLNTMDEFNRNYIFVLAAVGTYLSAIAVGLSHGAPDGFCADVEDATYFDEGLGADPRVSVRRDSGHRIRIHVVRFHALDGFVCDTNEQSKLITGVTGGLARVTNLVCEFEMKSIDSAQKANIALLDNRIMIMGVHKNLRRNRCFRCDGGPLSLFGCGGAVQPQS